MDDFKLEWEFETATDQERAIWLEEVRNMILFGLPVAVRQDARFSKMLRQMVDFTLFAERHFKTPIPGD